MGCGCKKNKGNGKTNGKLDKKNMQDLIRKKITEQIDKNTNLKKGYKTSFLFPRNYLWV